jgi:hypothetical protein
VTKRYIGEPTSNRQPAHELLSAVLLVLDLTATMRDPNSSIAGRCLIPENKDRPTFSMLIVSP